MKNFLSKIKIENYFIGKVLPYQLCWAAFSCEEVGKLPSAPLDHNQPWWFSSEVTRVYFTKAALWPLKFKGCMNLYENLILNPARHGFPPCRTCMALHHEVHTMLHGTVLHVQVLSPAKQH